MYRIHNYIVFINKILVKIYIIDNRYFKTGHISSVVNNDSITLVHNFQSV